MTPLELTLFVGLWLLFFAILALMLSGVVAGAREAKRLRAARAERLRPDLDLLGKTQLGVTAEGDGVPEQSTPSSVAHPSAVALSRGKRVA